MKTKGTSTMTGKSDKKTKRKTEMKMEMKMKTKRGRWGSCVGGRVTFPGEVALFVRMCYTTAGKAALTAFPDNGVSA